MNLEQIKQNKRSMILQFSIPSIIAMVLTSLITIVDGFFIGNYVGKEGLAAVNLGLPIVYLFLAVGLMISVGGVAIAGISYGSGDSKHCNHVFNQTILTTVVVSIVLSIVVGCCFEPMLRILNAEGLVAVYFKDYYGIMLLELPIIVINASFGMFIRSEGNPQFYMKVSILNVVLNIVLDYLFIRWFDWGVTGIAVASLLAAAVMLWCILYFFWKKSGVYFLGRFVFSTKVLKGTLLNGSSEFVGEMSMSISMFAYNYVILKNIGVDGVTAFTIVGYVSYLFSMVIIGFGQGASPLISFTYGAKDYQTASEIRKISNKFVFIAGVVVFLLVVCCSGWYSNLFLKNKEIEKMICSGIPIFAISFLFSGINTICSFYFTSIGKAMESAIISFARGLVILLICIFTLPVWFGMTGVWLVAPVTEILTIFISFTFLHNTKSRIAKVQ